MGILPCEVKIEAGAGQPKVVTTGIDAKEAVTVFKESGAVWVPKSPFNSSLLLSLKFFVESAIDFKAA